MRLFLTYIKAIIEYYENNRIITLNKIQLMSGS